MLTSQQRDEYLRQAKARLNESKKSSWSRRSKYHEDVVADLARSPDVVEASRKVFDLKAKLKDADEQLRRLGFSASYSDTDVALTENGKYRRPYNEVMSAWEREEAERVERLEKAIILLAGSKTVEEAEELIALF